MRSGAVILLGLIGCHTVTSVSPHRPQTPQQESLAPIHLIAPISHAATSSAALIFRWADVGSVVLDICEDVQCESIVESRRVLGHQYQWSSDDWDLNYSHHFWRVKGGTRVSAIRPMLVGPLQRYLGAFLSSRFMGSRVRVGPDRGIQYVHFYPRKPNFHNPPVVASCSTDFCRADWGGLHEVGDLDNDRNDDVIGEMHPRPGQPAEARVLLYANRKDQRVNTVELTLRGLRSILPLGDVNDDGYTDLVAIRDNGDVVWVAGPIGSQQRTVHRIFVGVGAAASLAVKAPYDFNGDGYSDALLQVSGTWHAVWGSPYLQLEHSELPPAFQTATTAPDLDLDGADELVTVVNGTTIPPTTTTFAACSATSNLQFEQCLNYEVGFVGREVIPWPRSQSESADVYVYDPSTQRLGRCRTDDVSEPCGFCGVLPREIMQTNLLLHSNFFPYAPP